MHFHLKEHSHTKGQRGHVQLEIYSIWHMSVHKCRDSQAYKITNIHAFTCTHHTLETCLSGRDFLRNSVDQISKQFLELSSLVFIYHMEISKDYEVNFCLDTK